MDATLSVRGLSKRYGSLQALEGVTLDFQAREVHAVVGANGAGKSTLASILGGFVPPSSGEVVFEGAEIPYGRPHECRDLGIETVHQHFTLVPEFSVADNLALSGMGSLGGALNVAKASEPALALASRLGWNLDPDQIVGRMPVGVQQRVEIVKALAEGAKVAILDEPTAVLAESEVDDLFRVVRGLRDQGTAVMLIAHKLGEVMALADRISVLRDGRLVGTWLAREVDEARLAQAMVGDRPAMGERHHTPSGSALRVENLVVAGDRAQVAVSGVSFEVRGGEVFGFGGVDGNGQVELAEALAGARKPLSGRIEVGASDASHRPGSFHVGYIPPDRRSDGLALDLSVGDNLLAGAFRRSELGRGPFLSRARVSKWAESVVRAFGVKCRGIEVPVAHLSGGNQQKVVLGRTLDQTPDLLVAVNPTRGLDVASADAVLESIHAACRAGAAVALFSSDKDELHAAADRVVYLGNGRLHDTAEAALGVGR